jgi:hypothetical protein
MRACSFGTVRGQAHEYADPPHPLWLLSPRDQRPRRRTAESRDELAPSYPSLPERTR